MPGSGTALPYAEGCILRLCQLMVVQPSFAISVKHLEGLIMCKMPIKRLGSAFRLSKPGEISLLETLYYCR